MSAIGGKLPVRWTWLLGPLLAKSRLSRFTNVLAKAGLPKLLFPSFAATAKLMPWPRRHSENWRLS